MNRAAAQMETLPMALLDRDGVINVDIGYAHRIDQIIWVDGVFAVLARLKAAGYRTVVVTNQSGIARGLYGESDVDALHRWMANETAVRGGLISAFYYCPFHPDAVLAEYRREHFDRKPSPGMILRALRDFPTDITRSFLIGDNCTDVAAATAAGLSGFQFQGGNLEAFVDWVLKEKRACGQN